MMRQKVFVVKNTKICNDDIQRYNREIRSFNNTPQLQYNNSSNNNSDHHLHHAFVQRRILASEHYTDFTIQYPPRREYFKEKYTSTRHLSQLLPSAQQISQLKVEDGEIMNKKKKNMNYKDTKEYKETLLLYCHIPFCEQKCFYCNFAVDIRKSEELHSEYVTYLENALSVLSHYLFLPHTTPPSTSTHSSPIHQSGGGGYKIGGIDIGGGTPTSLSVKLLERVVRALRPFKERCAHALPLSIETTPTIVCKHTERLEMLKEEGTNRVSMGLQSTDAEILRKLNRGIQTPNYALQAIDILKQRLRFERVSCDIIFGLPLQTMEMWDRDLRTVIDSSVDVVTTYDCLYRGKGRAMSNRNPEIPSCEMYGAMYDYGYDLLTKEGGFHAPYGSVNFSRINNETGTSAYFEGRLLDGYQYVGVGNYASSLCGNHWFFAPYSVDQWLADIQVKEKEMMGKKEKEITLQEKLDVYFPIGDIYDLPWQEIAAKYILLTLSFGVIDPKRFRRMFGMEFEEMYATAISFALENNYLWKSNEDGNYYITYGQFKNMPIIRSLFYSQEAIDWLVGIKQNPSSLRAYKKREKPISSEVKITQ